MADFRAISFNQSVADRTRHDPNWHPRQPWAHGPRHRAGRSGIGGGAGRRRGPRRRCGGARRPIGCAGRFLRARRRSRRISPRRARRARRSSSAPPASSRAASCADRQRRGAQIAVLQTGNTSLGVTLLARLVARGGGAGSGPTGTSRSSRRITGTRSMRRRAPRCCSARRRRRGAASTLDELRCVDRAGLIGARARRARSASPRCAADRSPATISVIFAGDGRADRARPPRRKPRRSSRAARCARRCGSPAKPAGPLHDGARCSGL